VVASRSLTADRWTGVGTDGIGIDMEAASQSSSALRYR
jgi:hypothetical protein